MSNPQPSPHNPLHLLTQTPSLDPGIPAPLAQGVLTAETAQEANARIAALSQYVDLNIKLATARQDIEDRTLERQHKRRMELLRTVITILSGISFVVLGLLLIRDSDAFVKYGGFICLAVGACALIPGVSGIFKNVAELAKTFKGIATALREAADKMGQDSKSAQD